MKKLVLQLDYYDDKIKQKAMQKVSGLAGIELIAIDSKEKKLTVVGEVDPVNLVYKLRKLCRTDIVSVGPAKEPEKKKEEPKKGEDNKDEPKKGGNEKRPGGGGGEGIEKKPGGGGDAKKPGGGGSGESKGDAVKAFAALPPPPAYQQQLQPFPYYRPQFPQYPPPAAYHQFPYQRYPPPPAPVYYMRGEEEDPNSCAIC